MGISILVFLLAIVVFVVFFRLAMVYIGKVFGKAVFGRHKDAEYIVETGAVPPEWRNRAERVVRRAGAPESAWGRRVRERERGKILKRLGDLLKYFDTAPVFKEEEARHLLMDELNDARERWKSADWEQLLAEPAASGDESGNAGDHAGMDSGDDAEV